MSHPFQDIYDRIPKIKCQGHCGRNRHDTCCGPIGCTGLEAELLDSYLGIKSPWIECVIPGDVKMDIEALFPTTICPHLGLDGRCRSYEVRPTICRLWGVMSALKCPWGCKPEKYLTSTEAAALMEEASLRHQQMMHKVVEQILEKAP